VEGGGLRVEGGEIVHLVERVGVAGGDVCNWLVRQAEPLKHQVPSLKRSGG
jgi:hypothetical protein